MNDLSNQQIMVNLQNLSLKLFCPYCLDYTAFPIATGNLNFVSKNNIRSNNIESINIVDVYKMKVGDKHKELKPPYKVPLKLALYILKDMDDKIKFDLPVKGSIKDPFTFEEVQGIKTNDDKFTAFVDTLITKKGNAITNISFQEKINALYIPDTLMARYQKNLILRNDQLKSYLITTGGLDPKNLSILTAEKPSLDAYNDKPKYKIDKNLPGAEKPDALSFVN